jgi:hypothetical protein
MHKLTRTKAAMNDSNMTEMSSVITKRWSGIFINSIRQGIKVPNIGQQKTKFQ